MNILSHRTIHDRINFMICDCNSLSNNLNRCHGYCSRSGAEATSISRSPCSPPQPKDQHAFVAAIGKYQQHNLLRNDEVNSRATVSSVVIFVKHKQTQKQNDWKYRSYWINYRHIDNLCKNAKFQYCCVWDDPALVSSHDEKCWP